MSQLRAQQALGSLLVCPPRGWSKFKEEFVDWQHEGVESTVRGLPYTLNDMLFFAKFNFSPDMWFTVVRGPMTGKVFWWTHDGDSMMIEPWANDIQGWGDRVCREVPGLFSGVIRFGGDDCIEDASPDAVLVPERYVADRRTGRS
jgi:hypothetical protein